MPPTPKATVQLVEPPLQRRPRESSADPKIVAALAENAPKGWASFGFEAADKKGASNKAGVYRNAVRRKLNLGKKGVKSRVWELPNKKWTFALTTATPTEG